MDALDMAIFHILETIAENYSGADLLANII